jgi:Chromo (CHRromatin Organisation MOdifier) domain
MSHSRGGQSSNPTPSAPAQTQGLDEDDDISITSTISDEEREYEVEEVVYQLSNEEGVMLYLVKWAGYDDVENTWEPETSFIDPSTLEDWGKKQDAISRGLEPEFDIEAWNKRKSEYEAANEVTNAKRRSRRKAKRRRLGLSVSSSSNDSEFSDTMDLTDAVRSPRSRGRRGYLETDYDESEYTSMREQRSRERVRGSRDSSLSSTDSLMEDLRRKSKQTGTDRQNLEKGVRMSKDSTEPSHDQQKKQVTPKKLGVGRLKKPEPKKPGPEVAKRPTQTPRKAVDPKAAVVARQKEPIEKPPVRKAPLTALGPAKEVLAAAGIRTTIAPMRKTTGAVATKSRNGPGKLAKRTGHSTQHTTAPGRDVLQNWTSKPKQKKPIKPAVGRPRSPEAKLYKNLATKRRAELRGRKEATPDVNSLDLCLPGDYHRPLPKLLAPATSPSSTQLHSDGLDSLFEDKGLGDEGSAIQIDEEPLQFTPRSGIQDKSWPVVRDNNVDMQEIDASNDSRQHYVDRNLHIGSPVLTPVGSNEQSITDRNQSPVQSTDSLNMSPADPPSLGTKGGYPKSRPIFYADLLGPVPQVSQAQGPFDISRQLSHTKHFFEHGDLLVTIRIFNQVVGDVRLRGLDEDSRRSVYRMKKNHEIDISLEGVLTIEDYKSLVLGVSLKERRLRFH